MPLPSAVRSGVTPKYSCAPPLAKRKPVIDFVEHQQRAMLARQFGDALEKSFRRRHRRHRLEDDSGEFARPFAQQLLQGVQIVVVEAMGQRPRRHRHAAVARGAADVPILPAMIAANSHMIAAGEGAGNADAAGGGVGAVLAEAHGIGARHHLDDQLGDLDLDLMGQREDHAVFKLAAHRCRHVGIVVAQGHRRQAVDEIDILVAIGIPQLAALARAPHRTATRHRGTGSCSSRRSGCPAGSSSRHAPAALLSAGIGRT